MAGKKYIYDFNEGDASMKALLGGKGANLAQMSKIGLPVPPGFIITTDACKAYWTQGQGLIDEIWPDVLSAVARVESASGKKLGSLDNPLLVSVRSGAPVSMPGMMDTILNLGLNDATVEALAKVSGDARFAYDSYRRFIQMFSGVVLDVSAGKDEEDPFEEKLSALRKSLDVEFDHQIPADSLKKLITDYKEIVKKAGHEFPSDPEKQLRLAIEAVFRSWNTPRANTYRELNNISADLGTAVNIVTMAFGNLGSDCGTGVCFTRDGSTGENRLYGEYLMNAQGEDVVAGIRTPSPIAELENVMPDVYKEFFSIAKLLENHYKDMQDIEFTVERGKLYILQTRDGKRTAAAAVKIAMDLYREGLIDARTAVSRVSPDQVEQLLHPQIDPKAKYKALAKGLPASPGAAVGEVVFDADDAAEKGKTTPVILVRPETTPDDIHGLFAAKGVLTSHGGMTSHAAVVARGMGRPCVSGAESVKIDLKAGKFTVGDVTIKKGDFISLDGTKGVVIVGKVPLIEPTFSDDFKALLDMADKESKLQVWANADTPEDAKRAFDFGAKGVGLCRTEHMFMAADRLPSMQKMVIASAKEARVAALASLEPMQKSDFVGIFEAMGGYPVIIRLLDPPLHEFLPNIHDLKKELSEVGADSDRGREIKVEIARSAELHEFNPMLGFRGCRLGIVYPEIFEMQIRAIIAAACEVSRKGLPVKPEIMMPLVGIKEEMRRLEKMAREIAAEVMKSEGVKVDYKVGTMIEVPRAAMVADEIAEYAEFFSFGTNDLTQTTYGYSRDDAENKFLGFYVEDKVIDNNPFHVLDRDGVGGLMKIAKEKGRGVRPSLSVGICGEHGGNPSSVAFCHAIGLDYVSCSPFRVPVARLAAAHSALGKLK
ncbi:MAG: pyruvate, phosphate dikinase [Synergistaceae bacterium]|jgi:pyruvate,orthophosphate dikinase|nr:pyruvate, phosphate dikinase [Synergistaceae bacterium]